MKKTINYLETFTFPDIDELYPTYAISESGRVVNFKSIIYPNPRSKKKFTRKKQLSFRSAQAKIFDALINIGYFRPLTVYSEFPVLIKNTLREPGQEGLFLLLDYYFPDLRLAVELDSEYHDSEKDKIRDRYLEKLGITVFRLEGLHKVSVQKKEFQELKTLMLEREITERIKFNFQDDIKRWLEKQ